ncbi:hypothetical protein CU254_22940 [Amycolatopsis sp. AA4]|uniref:hypothetical protein n=1 Tax=Actinomycetes TaxID=1760 RepID=UPI0001B5404F|nr:MULTISPECIES: hypothetical protein [Actinomycetes]ATY12981.1 hypothetical protein CU254_22940 [Amycolatopsis sp. AA4]EFL08840.1 predicted protein [Streptomyces sp. AA4]
MLEQAADGEPDDPFTTALRGRYNELERERTQLVAEFDARREAEAAAPKRPKAEDIGLLDALPRLNVDFEGSRASARSTL